MDNRNEIEIKSYTIEWGGGLHMWGNNQVEAGGTGGERIHLRQNKGDRSVLNTSQGSSGQDSKGETVCKETVCGGCI